MRIQFDVPEALFERALRYMRDPKFRHHFAHDAFEERVNRLEGRDRKLLLEQTEKNRRIFRDMVLADREWLLEQLEEIK